MVKINWTRQAVEDIYEISEYFRLHSEKYAEHLTNKFFEKSEYIASYPQMGRMIPEFDRIELRELIYKNYRIIYQIISSERIDIIAVHNGLRPLTEESIFG